MVDELIGEICVEEDQRVLILEANQCFQKRAIEARCEIAWRLLALGLECKTVCEAAGLSEHVIYGARQPGFLQQPSLGDCAERLTAEL